MLNLPYISFVIPTWCRKDLLAKVIEAIKLQVLFHSKCELLICDSNSPDGTGEMVKAFIAKNGLSNCTYLNIPKNTPSAKRNAGIRASRGEWIVLLDDDCVIHSNYLDALIAKIESASTNKLILCGDISYPSDWVRASNYFRYRNSRHVNEENNSGAKLIKFDFKTITTMNMALHRESILHDGILFDEEYLFYCEDTDFGWRLQQAGYTFSSVNAGVTHYETSGSLGNYCLKLSRASAEGFPILNRKFPMAASETIWHYLECPPGFVGNLKRILLNIVFNKFAVNQILLLLEKNDSKPNYYSPLLYKYVLAGAYLGKIKR